MSQFEFVQEAQQTSAKTIEVDTLLHWVIVAVLSVSILVITYLLISKCTAYWTHRINQWRYGSHKKHDSEEDDEEDEQ